MRILHKLGHSDLQLRCLLDVSYSDRCVLYVNSDSVDVIENSTVPQMLYCDHFRFERLMQKPAEHDHDQPSRRRERQQLRKLNPHSDAQHSADLQILSDLRHEAMALCDTSNVIIIGPSSSSPVLFRRPAFLSRCFQFSAAVGRFMAYRYQLVSNSSQFTRESWK